MNLFSVLFPGEKQEPQEVPEPTPTSKHQKPNYIHKTRELVKKTFDAIRNRSKCADCGWSKIPALLEFHHTIRGSVRPRAKRRDLSMSPRMSTSISKMEVELKKGVFLCPTCHKMRHYNSDTGKVESSNKDLF